MKKLDTRDAVREVLANHNAKQELKESIANMMVFWVLATRGDLQKSVFTKSAADAAKDFPESVRTGTDELTDIIEKIQDNAEELSAVLGTLELYADRFWWTRRTFCAPAFIVDEMLKAAGECVDSM